MGSEFKLRFNEHFYYWSGGGQEQRFLIIIKMGIPKFFKWLTARYPMVLENVERL